MSGEQQRTSSAPTSTDDKTNSKDFSPFQKFIVVGIALSTLGGIWFFVSGQAATTFDVTLSPTTVAETLTTNPSLETGLVAHWTFDGEQMDWSSTTAEARDRSGNENHANTDASMTARLSTTPGVMGQAALFDGVNDQVVTGTDTSHDNLGPLTLAAWIRPTRPGANNYCILGKSYMGPGNEGWGFAIDANDGLFFARPMASGILQRFSVFPVVVEDEWQHVAVTWDGSTDAFNGVALYRNGEVLARQYSQNAGPVGSDAGQAIILGNTDGGCDSPYKGALDDVRVYNRVLSAEEIKRLYGLGASTRVSETLTTNPQLEQGLVGHWTFDGEHMDWSSTTAEVRDRSSNNNYGNAQGGMSTRSVAPGMLGQGLLFDGLNDFVEVPHKPALSFDTGDDFAVSLWTKIVLPQPEVSATDNDILSKWNGGVGYPFAIRIHNQTGGVPGLVQCVRYDGSAVVQIHTGTTIADGGMHHVICQKNGALLSLYVDGVRRATTTDTMVGSTANTAPVRFGTRLPTVRRFAGALDDVRIYNRALSTDEIKRLYQLGQ